MSVKTIEDVEFGVELPVFEPDTSLGNVGAFARAVGWGGARFESHEGAREEGFPGALVPGIMGMGFLTSAIHQWAPAGSNLESSMWTPCSAHRCWPTHLPSLAQSSPTLTKTKALSNWI